ncbi:MAG: imidazole glycerol phosphate synthase subunit HisH [Methanomassiliicoccaceae archaeon]|nr:imidazole glycerol phosphate synthase subunit HisH [Methanomassiliicoccaceae archaeon]
MEVTVSLADYGVGNLHSINKALRNAGGDVRVVTDMRDLIDSECIVFPGVGAFDRTMERLIPYRDDIRAVLGSGVPVLGICIGMHILFDGSEEGGTEGLGLISGRVKRLTAGQVPHMGWNSVDAEDEIFGGVDSRYFYFAHSYFGSPEDRSLVIGTTEHGGAEIPVLFRKKNVYGCQFHPEKSGLSGGRFIRNFIEFAKERQ